MNYYTDSSKEGFIIMTVFNSIFLIVLESPPFFRSVSLFVLSNSSFSVTESITVIVVNASCLLIHH